MSEHALVDINNADAASLANLPGIGEVLAVRIIEYRETVHPFEEIMELTAVPGISERMVRQIEDQIMVSQRPAVMIEVETETETETEGGEPAQEMITAVTQSKAAPELETQAEPAEDVEEMEPQNLTEPAPEVAPEPEAARRGVSSVPTVTAPAATPPVVAPSQRRGCVLVLLGSLLGAFLGMALTLAVLAALNDGRLQFSQEAGRLRGEVGTLQQSQVTLQTQLSTAEAQAAVAGQQLDNYLPLIETMATRQGDLLTAQATAQAGLANLGANLAEIEEETAVLAERVENVAAAAEAFEVFLSGLRALLTELDVSEAVPLTGTVTVTPTPPLPGELSTTTPRQVTPGSSLTPTLVPTRTPRPTATPIGQPTTES